MSFGTCSAGEPATLVPQPACLRYHHHTILVDLLRSALVVHKRCYCKLQCHLFSNLYARRVHRRVHLHVQSGKAICHTPDRAVSVKGIMSYELTMYLFCMDTLSVMKTISIMHEWGIDRA